MAIVKSQKQFASLQSRYQSLRQRYSAAKDEAAGSLSPAEMTAYFLGGVAASGALRAMQPQQHVGIRTFAAIAAAGWGSVNNHPGAVAAANGLVATMIEQRVYESLRKPVAQPAPASAPVLEEGDYVPQPQPAQAAG